MTEKEKYVDIYSGNLAQYYNTHDDDGIRDGGYGRRMWGENAIPFLREHNAKSVLDIGCGYGRFCDAISDFVDLIYGVDIASIETKNTVKNNKIIFLNANANNLQLISNCVEWVTAFDILEHPPENEIDKILNECDRVSTKGFIFSISYDPCHCNNVQLHLTVKSQDWWIEKIQKYGKTYLWGSVPIINTPYIICEKKND